MAGEPGGTCDGAPLAVVTLLGVPVHRVTARQAIEHIVGESSAGRGGWVVTPNLDILRRLATEPEFRRLCEGATLRLPDGMPLIWASRLQRTPLPERVAGSDMIWSLTAAAAERGLSVFLLGGNPGAAEAAAKELTARHPSLHIAGTMFPPFGFEKSIEEMDRIRRALSDADPAVVYVALGSPKQEALIREMRPVLPRAWFLGIGISFSFVSGEVKRAPAWMRRIGLEWFHRLCQEPRRLFRRYIIDGVPFAARLFITAWWRGARHPRPSV